MENEEGETIEFYKIQLMLKDQQISNFEAKMKKIEFKHSRDIKEVKIAQERATDLLKQQKAKIDKLTKQAKQNQEQNALLQMRLNEIKEEKQKEVSQVKAQYNKIKEEVRSYQRILPTHTFLSECGISISQLPTYEDIFMNFKEKVSHYQQLNNKFQSFKQKYETEVESFRQNEQHLKEKKIEAERNLKQILPKLQQSQQIINDFKASNQQLQGQVVDLRNQLDLEKSKNVNLQDLLKENDLKIQQISQAFTNQVHNKEQELRFAFQQQSEKYQAQIRSLTSRYELKENMFLSQISILQEDSNYLKGRLQDQKQRYEQIIQEAKEEILSYKDIMIKQRKLYDEKVIQNDGNKKNLINLSKNYEQLQMKLRLSEGKLKQIEIQLQQKIKNEEQQVQRRLVEIKQKSKIVQKSNEILKSKLGQLQQEKQRLNEDLSHLKNQIGTKHLETKDVVTKNSLDIPSYFEQYSQKIRKGSNQFDRLDQEIQIVSVQKEEYVRQRAKTLETIKQLQEFEVEIAKLNDRNNDLNKEKVSLQDSLNVSSQRIRLLEQKITKIERQCEQINNNKQMITVQLEISKGENIKVHAQIDTLKQSLNNLNKHLNQKQNKLYENTTKINLQKAKIQSIQQQLKLINEQSRKEKENNKVLKDQLKRLKQQNTIASQKLLAESKSLASQIQQLKQEKNKLIAQIATHQKEIQSNASSIQRLKESEQKLKKEFNEIQKKLTQSEQQYILHEKNISQLNKQILRQKKSVQKLQEQIWQKDREHELLSQSLDRERRQRTLRHVPSLQALNEDEQAQEQNFNQIYKKVTQKQGEINFLQRQISDLKQEMQALKQSHNTKIQLLQGQQNEYIQTIITMKMRCAQSEMKASQKEHLYNQIKKKLNSMGVK